MLTGRWLDLWDHPEHDTCKILKGIREIDDGMQLPGSPKLPSTEDTTAGTIEARDGNRLTPAKVVDASSANWVISPYGRDVEGRSVFGCAREVNSTLLASLAEGEAPTYISSNATTSTVRMLDALLLRALTPSV